MTNEDRYLKVGLLRDLRRIPETMEAAVPNECGGVDVMLLGPLGETAADEIDRLRAENAQFRKEILAAGIKEGGFPAEPRGEQGGFRVGSKVRWKSQAGGQWTTKEGVIAAVITAGQVPDRVKFRFSRSSTALGGPRDHDSYVVFVGRNSYWPRVSALEAVRTSDER